MAFEIHNTAHPALAASNVNARTVVAKAAGERAVVPAATNGVEPFGVALATGLQGAALTVHPAGNTVKAVAAASVGGGADVGVATSNGAVGPVVGASGVVRWRTGVTEHPASAGEVVSIFVHPRQLSGLA